MLPGFRLIALTFCCGFLVVFVGLRLATSVNGLHQAMPVMAAHAAPVTVGAIADRELRRGQSAVPVMYDMRFAVGSAVPAAPGAQPVIDRAPPVMMPLVILPPIALEAERNAAPEADTSVVAALALPPAAKPEPPVVIDIPLTEPAPVDLTFVPPAAAKEKPVAAAAPQATPQAPLRTFDIPLPEPAPVDLTLPPAQPETDGGATVEKRAETDARAKPIELAALATDVPTGTVKLPTKSIPLPRSRPAIQTAAVQTVPAKPRPRRAVARTTQQDGFDNFFGFPSGRPQ